MDTFQVISDIGLLPHIVSSDAEKSIITGIFLLTSGTVSLLTQYSQHIILLLAIGITYYLYRPVDWFYDFTTKEADKSAKGFGSAKQRLLYRFNTNESSPTKINLYPNGWFNLLNSAEVGVNQVKYVAALGENFAVFRKSDGKVQVVDAYCPHMGTNLAIGGVVKDDCLQCPFHGWQFDGEGKCTKIPYAEKIPATAKVRAWRCAEVNRIVYVWYHADAEEPTYEPEPITEIMNGDYSYVGRCVMLTDTDIEDLQTNYADYIHFDILHVPTVFTAGVNSVGLVPWIVSSLFKLELSSEWWSDTDAPHRSWCRTRTRILLFKKFTLLDVKALVKIIATGISDVKLSTNFGDLWMILSTVPRGPLNVSVQMQIYCRPALMLLGKLIIKLFTNVFEQDILIFTHHKMKARMNLVKEDGAIVQFRRWYKQFWSEKSRYMNIQSDVLSW